MIPTSRNVSTFFFWHFPIHAQRICAVKSWILQWEHAASNPAPNVPAGGKMSPQGPRLRDHVMTTCGDRSRIQDGLWAAWGSGGKGPHWPLTIQLQTLARLAGARRWTNPWPHFPWFTEPQSTLPSLVAGTDGGQGGGLQVLRKKDHCATMRILLATATQPPSLGHRGTWQILGLRGSEDGYVEMQVREAGLRTSWQTLQSNTYTKGCKHCHLCNH